MQHSPSPFNRYMFSLKSSIIDVPLSSKYASDNYLSVLTLNSMLSFKLPPFDFLFKETLTILFMLILHVYVTEFT